MINQLKRHVEDLHKCYVSAVNESVFIREDEKEALRRKQERLKSSKAEIVKNIVDGRIITERSIEGKTIIDYGIKMQNVIRRGKRLYIEEQVQVRRAVTEGGEIIDDYVLYREGASEEGERNESSLLPFEGSRRSSPAYSYDRMAVVRYAERWWNDYNPAYKVFENNCTNYVSQCLMAGGAPMWGIPQRTKGWWYRNNSWSFSWSVAHALRWYLSGAKEGLQAVEVERPEDLLNGDIICYDFNGDGRWQHTTIVTAKDEENMPLVNAQTTNSRMRYWAYEDSTAWTPEIKYKFFHIIDRDF
ncbi:amidase domain-containing protein [Evansella clarkii]|uniref:amidase domain-containing protein n=1 Tax=Evansella clarkii TaxID=79879 RepID=UPI001AD9532B|nr:amidase domain-containing protein [Evansella clarkii]